MKILYMCFMVILAISCTKEEHYIPSESLKSDKTSTLTINLQSEELATRTLSELYEKRIININIFLRNIDLGIEKYLYYTNRTSVEVELENGEWEIYAIANHESSLNYLTYEQASNYTAYITQVNEHMKSNAIVMTYSGSFNLSSSQTLNMIMERVVAKCNISVSVSPEMQGVIDIKSIEVVNIPDKSSYFSDYTPISAPLVYSAESNNFSFYMYENMQGVRPSITSPQDKMVANAPINATYLLIKATVDMAEVEYRFYLGGNTTNDFNIKRNTEYTINVMINGISTSDMRVTVKVYDLNIEYKIPFESDYERSGMLVIFRIVSSDNSDITISLKNIVSTRTTLRLFDDATYIEQSGRYDPDLNYAYIDYDTDLNGSSIGATIKPNTYYRLYIETVRESSPTLKMDMVFNDGKLNEEIINVNLK